MDFATFEKLKDQFSPPHRRRMFGDRTLAELLGHSQEDKLLIINADDFGLCPSSNEAVHELLTAGKVTSISTIALSKAFDDAIIKLKKSDHATGVHLALTSEWEGLILRPLSALDQTGSLLDDSGRLHADLNELYSKAKISEIETECRAQIKLFADSQVAIDHLDTHMGVMQLAPPFLELYLRLAQELSLPLRLGSAALAARMGIPSEMLKMADEMRLIFPDNLIYIPMSFTAEKEMRFLAYDYVIKNLPTGVTEIYFHPSLNGLDFQSMQHRFSARKGFDYKAIRLWDYEYIASGRLEQILREEKIIKISYEPLKRIAGM